MIYNYDSSVHNKQLEKKTLQQGKLHRIYIEHKQYSPLEIKSPLQRCQKKLWAGAGRIATLRKSVA